jgi:hypothetical protein
MDLAHVLVSFEEFEEMFEAQEMWCAVGDLCEECLEEFQADYYVACRDLWDVLLIASPLKAGRS